MNIRKTIKLFGIVTATVLLVGSLSAKGLETHHGNIADGMSEKSDVIKPKYQGVILEVLDAKAYTYLKVDEKTPGYDPKKLKAFWIVVDRSSAQVGDYVRFQKELVTKNFKSKELKRTFDEVMFASKLEYRVSK